MGRALSQALAEALQSPGHPGDWPAEFSKAFTDVAGISRSSYLVSPDALSRSLADAVQVLQAGESWMATVSRRLQLMAIPVFDRREQLTPGAATSIRLAALCLAVEADARYQREIGGVFREIAAGITLLERRANGDDPATETIILASE